MGVLRLAGRRQVKLFARKDQYGRFISCLVYLPRDRFTTANRLRMQEILLNELNGIGVDYTTRVSDTPLARIHFIVRTDPTHPVGEIDPHALSARLAEATRRWEDDFVLLLERKLGEVQAHELLDRYADGLPDTYKDTHTAGEAAQDIAMLELLDEPGQLVLHLFRRRKRNEDVRFKVFRFGEPMRLSDVLPCCCTRSGVRVEDERPYEIRRSDGLPSSTTSAHPAAGCLELAEVRSKWRMRSPRCARRGRDGPFNELVLRAGLTWRQVVVLRAYAK